MYWKIWIIFERTEIYSSNFKVIYKDLSKQNLMGQNSKIFRYLRYLKIFCIIWNLNIEYHFHPWFVAFLKILILCIQLHTKTIFKYVKGFNFNTWITNCDHKQFFFIFKHKLYILWTNYLIKFFPFYLF